MFIVTVIVIVVVVLGYVSGNQPKRNAISAAEEQLGIKLESQRITVGDVSLNVIFAGPKDGTPVILLHGYPEFWYAWRGPMAVLAKAGYRVIVPDQLGYNDSDKPSDVEVYRLDKLADNVSSLIDVLGYSKVYLAGHDFGALVSWWTLILHSEKIEKFAIINKPHPKAPLVYDGEGEKISWYRTFLQIPWLPGYVGRLANWFLLVKNLRATSLPETFSNDSIDQYRSAWANNGAINSMGAWYRANADFEMNVNMNISVPGLFVLAPDDAFSPRDLGHLSMQFLDNGEMLELEEGTHWVIQEKPELIGEILVNYFEENSAACDKMQNA